MTGLFSLLKMDNDKIVSIIYIILGIVAAYLSNVFNSFVIAVVLSSVIFASTQYLFVKKLNPPKLRRFIAENTVTFTLIWLVVWIFLFNIK